MMIQKRLSFPILNHFDVVGDLPEVPEFRGIVVLHAPGHIMFFDPGQPSQLLHRRPGKQIAGFPNVVPGRENMLFQFMGQLLNVRRPVATSRRRPLFRVRDRRRFRFNRRHVDMKLAGIIQRRNRFQAEAKVVRQQINEHLPGHGRCREQDRRRVGREKALDRRFVFIGYAADEIKIPA